jgi:vancomycin permeability regulator SanA
LDDCGLANYWMMTMKRKYRLVAGIVLSFFLALFTPLLAARVIYAKNIHFQLATISPAKYGIVFGASVFRDQTLSAVTQERADAAVLLYKNALIEKIFVSADNRHNLEADAISAYLEQQGIPAEDITIDRIGIDTGDTCRHFSQFQADAILLTQEFHLPRAMFLCNQDGLAATGLAVNHLGLLKSRGATPFEIYRTRLERETREAVLIWAVLLGIYDRYSNEAELKENQQHE